MLFLDSIRLAILNCCFVTSYINDVSSLWNQSIRQNLKGPLRNYDLLCLILVHYLDTQDCIITNEASKALKSWSGFKGWPGV